VNFSEVQKSVGEKFRLRPIPARIRPDGGSLPVSDDPWRIEAATSDTRGVQLVNVLTGQSVHLHGDDLREFHSPDFLVLRCALTIQGDRIVIESSMRPRGPIPPSRYQASRQKTVEQWVPVESHICDGCTESVQYRPMIRIGLPADSQSPATTEQFCTPCARERGVNAVLAPGMMPGQVYARSNPTFSEYLRGMMKPIATELARNPELKSRGVTRVVAVASPTHLILQILLAGEMLEVPVPVETLEHETDRSAAQLTERALAAIREALENRRVTTG
jgi:hypothetical protein